MKARIARGAVAQMPHPPLMIVASMAIVDVVTTENAQLEPKLRIVPEAVTVTHLMAPTTAASMVIAGAAQTIFRAMETVIVGKSPATIHPMTTCTAIKFVAVMVTAAVLMIIAIIMTP